MHTNSKTGHKKCDLSLRKKKRFGIKATEEIRTKINHRGHEETQRVDIQEAPAKTFTADLR